MLLNTVEEIQDILPVSKTLTYNKIAPFISDAEDDLKKVISSEFYNELDNYTGVDANFIQAIKLLQDSIAYTAYFKGFDIMNATFSNQGIHRIESDAEGAGKKALFQRQEENLKNTFKVQGYNKLDKALIFLEDNKASFPIWTASDNYTLALRNFINSTEEFNNIYNIENSRLIFLKLRNFQRLAEDFTVLPLIGRAFFDELKFQIADSSIAGYNKAFLEFLQPAVAYSTINKGGQNLVYNLKDFGIIANTNVSNTANFKETSKITEEATNSLLNSAKKIADNYIQICAAYLKENINEFPTYRDSSAYDGDVNLYDRANGTNKIVMI